MKQVFAYAQRGIVLCYYIHVPTYPWYHSKQVLHIPTHCLNQRRVNCCLQKDCIIQEECQNTWTQHNKLKPYFQHLGKFMVLFKSPFKIVHATNMGPQIIPLHHIRVVDPCNYNAQYLVECEIDLSSNWSNHTLLQSFLHDCKLTKY